MAIQTRTSTGSAPTAPAAAANTGAAAPPASTESYAAGYARLAAIAERLKSATGAGTIDTLLADVQTARKLHRQLRGRLDAVRQELEADAAENEAGEMA